MKIDFSNLIIVERVVKRRNNYILFYIQFMYRAYTRIQSIYCLPDVYVLLYFIFQRRLNRPITSTDIHELLSEVPDLSCDERRLIMQARSEVSKEWSIFLKNATVTIRLDYQDIVVISGDGTNKLLVQQDGRGDIDCDWEEKGFGMKLRNGARSVGRFLFGIFGKVLSAITFSAPKALGWF